MITERRYDEKVMNMLLNLLKVDPPFRPITFKFLLAITFNFWYNKNISECLSDKQFDILNEAYINSIMNIKKLYQKPLLYWRFMEVFLSEWNNFEFIDHDLLIKTATNPWSIIPVFEEKFKEQLPDCLQIPHNELEELKYAINRFLILRMMIITLKLKYNTEVMSVYPFEVHKRDVDQWNIGEHVDVAADK